MKFSNDAGKVSVPGVPVAWRRVRGGEGPMGIIGQEGERVRDGYVRLDQSSALPKPETEDVELSDATRALSEEAKRAAFAVVDERRS
jgi:hypothetical protein